MESLLRDVRSAVRRLAGQRGFSAAALVTLALGIGANTAMFSIAYGLLLRPLPYPDSEGLVRVGERYGGRGSGTRLTNRSMPVLQDAASFEHLAAYRERSIEWAGPDGAVTLRGTTVSPSLFPMLRAAPHLGRLFTEEEGREGARRVVLLSHRAWTGRFAADPDVVGTSLGLDGDAHTVVGVLPEGFYFPNPAAELWTPFVVPPFVPAGAADEGGLRMAVVFVFSAIGRLAPGVSPARAAAEVSALLQGSASSGLPSPGPRPPRDRPRIEGRVVPLLEEMTGEYRPALLALSASTVLVLLIACINVSGLLLARGVARQRALAVCAALGASRARLVRQVLAESVVLGVAGGVLAVAAAAMVLRAVPALVPGDVARLHEVGVDGAALSFALGLSISAGLLLGAAPALQWSRLDLVRTLNEGGAQSAGGFRLLRSNRTRAALTVAQVSLALVLLVGAGLLLRSFVRLVTVDRGYDPANVIAARVGHRDLTLRPGMTPESIANLRAASRRFQESLVDEMVRLEGLSEVEAVGVSSGLPLASGGGGSSTSLRVAGAPPPTDPGDLPQFSLNVVTPGYFEALRLRLRAGRAFTGLDGAAAPPVLVVNETLAREVFGGQPAVGRRLLMAGVDEPWEVIGVVADIRYRGLAITESRGEAFMSLHQNERARGGGFFLNSVVSVRTAGDPLTVVPFLREAVAASSPGATVDDVMTMDARLSAAVAQPRFYAVLVGFFAALALFLAAFGIYALLSYTALQRRREIGVRMALGARRGDVLALVLRQGAWLVAAGTVLGLLAAAGSARLLESFLFGVSADDRPTFVAAPLVLGAVALVACWLPAHRAARVDPMDALRVE